MWVRVLAVGVVIAVFAFLMIYTQKIDVIYFRHPTCKFVDVLDSIASELKIEFTDKINMRIINVKMEDSDPEDSAEVKRLRQTYNVVGVPVVVINGKEFTDEFTKDNLESSICSELLLKPEVCT